MGNVINNWCLKISLTSKCNFNCFYCNDFQKTITQGRNELSDTEIKEIIKAAAEAGIKRIHWTGGEPSITNLVEFSNYAKSLGFEEQNITTNGYLMYDKLEKMIENGLVRTNISLDSLNREKYQRIVGVDGLESVIKTKLGDYSNIEMTIMFSKLSIEGMGKDLSLEEHFMLFNEYLKQISPIIKKYDGFVSKFLSGGFMTLFPHSEIDAVRAALEINDCTNKLNTTQGPASHKLTSWIGIHYGRMIIGTIGEENRLDDTVISDTVNTAARIESVCEKLGKNIIVSQVLHKKLSEESTVQVNLTELEAMFVKGKEKPLQLYEVSRKSRKVQESL